jgi:hypothetical protein
MIGNSLFFKRPEQVRIKPAVMPGSRPFIGHPRFGFHTMLNQDSAKPLPTAPAIVGGNLDWTKAKVTPNTQFLHNLFSDKRQMNMIPALGSILKLGEPNTNSVHT